MSEKEFLPMEKGTYVTFSIKRVLSDFERQLLFDLVRMFFPLIRWTYETIDVGADAGSTMQTLFHPKYMELLSKPFNLEQRRRRQYVKAQGLDPKTMFEDPRHFEYMEEKFREEAEKIIEEEGISTESFCVACGGLIAIEEENLCISAQYERMGKDGIVDTLHDDPGDPEFEEKSPRPLVMFCSKPDCRRRGAILAEMLECLWELFGTEAEEHEHCPKCGLMLVPAVIGEEGKGELALQCPKCSYLVPLKEEELERSSTYHKIPISDGDEED